MQTSSDNRGKPGRWARLTVSSLLILSTLLFLHMRSSGELVPARQSLEGLPMAIGDWKCREGEIMEDKVLGILKLSDYVMRRYTDPAGRQLWLYIGYWETQRKGAQIHSPKNCLPGGGWEPLEAGVAHIPIESLPSPIPVNTYLLQKGRDQQLVLYWYQSRGVAHAGEMGARIQMVRNSVLHNRSDGAIIRVSSPVYGNVEDTTHLLTRYVQALHPLLDQFLPE